MRQKYPAMRSPLEVHGKLQLIARQVCEERLNEKKVQTLKCSKFHLIPCSGLFATCHLRRDLPGEGKLLEFDHVIILAKSVS